MYTTALSQAQKRKSQRHWLGFLLGTNDEPDNLELLSDYFFNEFGESPNLLPGFMDSFKKKLATASVPSLKKKLARRYLDVLSRLCERFGLFSYKQTLDDLCFSILQPTRYRAIDSLLLNYKKTSQKTIVRITATLGHLLASRGFRVEMKGRYKNIYSIYRKLLKKEKKDILKLNDIFAFRIIALQNSAEGCFGILNLLHDSFQPIADFFKDYITIPKINGYQSLHTGLSRVLPDLDLPLEVQIRTQSMDDFAEHGVAAHWLYAEDKKAKLITEKEQKLMTYLSSRGAGDRDIVHGLSYTGDIIRLQSGSTVLDFAYLIHSELGHHAKKAIVNGKSKPVSYVIQEGDKIRIIAAKKPEVCANWLAYACTKHALEAITNYLNRNEPKNA